MKYLMLSILFSFTSFIAVAQSQPQSPPPAVTKITVAPAPKKSNYFSFSQQPVVRPNSIANDHYTQHFGFFCRKELQLEKSIKVPLRLRLGDLDYCNYLEGKTR